jgi:hypothetical protein
MTKRGESWMPRRAGFQDAQRVEVGVLDEFPSISIVAFISDGAMVPPA